MTLGSRQDVSAEMNVTPLIDVLLVLLIIFMVVLPHHHFGEKADIPLPSAPTTQSLPPATIVIQLLDSGDDERPRIEINHEAVRWGSLEARLRAIYQRRSDKVAFLKGDPQINFEYVADVIDISHRAGVDRVGLMGEKDQ
jgi:biopolymer transport protein TolR